MHTRLLTRLQLPPVFDNRGGTPQHYAFESAVWRRALPNERVLYLVHRQRDERFVRMLNELRRGTFSDESRRVLESCRQTKLRNPVRLFSRRVNVAQQNAEQLRRLPATDSVRYKAKDSGFKVDQLVKNCCAPDVLELKPGAQVVRLCSGVRLVRLTRPPQLLLKNLDIDAGLVNGSQGIVRGFTADRKRHPRVRFENGTERVITEAEWSMEMAGVEVAKRVQIPLMLAWACVGAASARALPRSSVAHRQRTRSQRQHHCAQGSGHEPG